MYKASSRLGSGGGALSKPGSACSRRQTILSGATDSFGKPIFLNYVNKQGKHYLEAFASEKAPLVLSFSIGPVEKIVSLTKSLSIDLTSYINSSNTTLKYFVYAQLDQATNEVSLGLTLFKPNYGYKSKTERRFTTANIMNHGYTCGFTTGYGSSIHSSYPASNWPTGSWICTQVTGSSVAGNWFAFSNIAQKVKTISMVWYYMPDVWKIQWSPDSTNGSNGTWNDIMTISGGNYAGIGQGQSQNSQPSLIQLPDYAASGTHMIRFYAVQSNSTAFSGYNWQFYGVCFLSTILSEESLIKERSSFTEGSNWLRRDTCIYSGSQGAADANAGWTCLFDNRQSWYWYANATGAQWFGVQNVPNTNPIRKVRLKGHDNNAYHAYGTMQWSPDGTTWNDIPGTQQMALTNWQNNQMTYCTWSEIDVPDYTPTGGSGTHRFRMIVTQAPSGTNHYAYTNGWHVYEAEILAASDYYSISDGYFYAPDGSVVVRVYLGEFETYTTFIQMLRNYPLMGKFESDWVNSLVNGGAGWYYGVHDAPNNTPDYEALARYGDSGIVRLRGLPASGWGYIGQSCDGEGNCSNIYGWTANSPLCFLMSKVGYLYIMNPNVLVNTFRDQKIDYTISTTIGGATYNTQNNAQTVAVKGIVDRGW